jgi:hypothetical protein
MYALVARTFSLACIFSTCSLSDMASKIRLFVIFSVKKLDPLKNVGTFLIKRCG